MRRTFVEFAVLSPLIIFAIIVVLFFIHIYRNQPVNNSKKDISPSIHYSTVEHNGKKIFHQLYIIPLLNIMDIVIFKIVVEVFCS